MEMLGTAARPLRIAVIGAGPAGLYAVEALLKKPGLVLTIDVFNRFPTPFGLVREGVAPDHEKIKKGVEKTFDNVLADPRVRFFGNVTYGVDIHHKDLKQYYDQIVYAIGALSDKKMEIPGEDLHNCIPATAFVGWYNGHPDYRDLPVDLSVKRAIVVGNGNVAMDVARILVKSVDELAKTDIADYALEELRDSKIEEVILLGRRGAAQAAFTYAEIKELGELEGVDVIVDPLNIILDPANEAFIELKENRGAKRNVECLREYASVMEHSAQRKITMWFLASPVEILNFEGKIYSVKIEHNELVPDNKGVLRPRGTGKFDFIEAGLILPSIGYRSVPIEGVPFDKEKSTISNIGGRVFDITTGNFVWGEYVVGWAKRGPTGLIGNNKPDSIATVEAMLADLPDLSGIEGVLCKRNVDFVTYQDWKVLDRHELSRGAEQNRPRVKVTTVGEMMEVIEEGRVR